MKSLPAVLLSRLCIPLAARSQTFEVHNSSGSRISVDTDDRNPALTIVVPDGPEGVRSPEILFPEHVTVRVYGLREQERQLFQVRHARAVAVIRERHTVGLKQDRW
jgi:hypothetical protein